MSSKFKGLGVAMVTPFNHEKEIDYDATERLIEHLIGGGVDYLVVLGTTGETATLSDKEKNALPVQDPELIKPLLRGREDFVGCIGSKLMGQSTRADRAGPVAIRDAA